MQARSVEVLYAEASDFDSHPTGGTLTFSKNFVRACPKSIVLVGITDDPARVGVWTRRELAGGKYDFLPVAFVPRGGAKRWLPNRVRVLLGVLRHSRLLREVRADVLFTRTPEIALVAKAFDAKRRLFCFAGLENSVGRGRFRMLRFLSTAYEWMLVRALDRRFDRVFASADRNAIAEFSRRWASKLRKPVEFFPTRVDESVFMPGSTEERNRLRLREGMSEEAAIFVSVGKVKATKGWRELLEVFESIQGRLERPARLVFIGSGEDFDLLRSDVEARALDERVACLGARNSAEVRDWLALADVFVSMSHFEGWSNAMVEALIVGLPVVTTPVSGAQELITEGKNGFVVDGGDRARFADALLSALSLGRGQGLEENLRVRLTVGGLKRDLEDIL